MKKLLKVVTIGGGSSYTPELVEGFILRYHELPIDELWLVDIEEGKEKLEIVASLARRMVEQANCPMKIISTLNREDALKDATFVTTQMRVGGLQARILDERIPISHGIMGQETNGAGGMFKAFRTIPVILDLVKDLERLCPDAWLINFTNPAGIITEAIATYTNFKNAIGLCNVPITMVNAIAKMTNNDVNDIDLEIAGLNHHFFVTDVTKKGASIFNEVMEHYLNANDDEVESMKNIMAIPWSPSLLKGMGVIPCSYLNYFYHTKEQLAKQKELFVQGNVRAEFVSTVEHELFELYKDPNLSVKPKQLESRGGAHYSDAACNLISSIYNNKGDIQYVDTLNKGTISNLPYNSVVEVACMITKQGPKPIVIGELPRSIVGTITNMKTFEQMVIQAAVEGNKDLAVAALCQSPLCDSDIVANKVVEELLNAHAKYLPQFKKGE